MQVMPEPQEEPNSGIEIDHESEVSSWVHGYILVCDKEHHLTKPSERYEYEDLVAYTLVTSSRYHSTFRETTVSTCY